MYDRLAARLFAAYCSFLIININIGELWQQWKWDSCSYTPQAWGLSGSAASIAVGGLVNMKHNKETVGDIMSTIGSRHPFALSPSYSKWSSGSHPWPCVCWRKEHKQLAETSRSDYVLNQSNQTAVVKRMSFKMPVAQLEGKGGSVVLTVLTRWQNL